MAVSIWRSPNPPFSLPQCLNSSPTGLPAFPCEQSTDPLSKHFYPSVLAATRRQLPSLTCKAPSNFIPNLTTHLTSFTTPSSCSKTSCALVALASLWVYLFMELYATHVPYWGCLVSRYLNFQFIHKSHFCTCYLFSLQSISQAVPITPLSCTT